MVAKWKYNKSETGGEWYSIDYLVGNLCTVRLLVSRLRPLYNDKWDCQVSYTGGIEVLQGYFCDLTYGYVNVEDAKSWCVNTFNRRLEKLKAELCKIESISISED